MAENSDVIMTVGRRKSASARVRLVSGVGKIVVKENE